MLIIFVHGGFIAILFVVSFFCLLRLQQSLSAAKSWGKKAEEKKNPQNLLTIVMSVCFVALFVFCFFFLSFFLSFCTSFFPPFSPHSTRRSVASPFNSSVAVCLFIWLFVFFSFFFFTPCTKCVGCITYVFLNTRFLFWSKCYLCINARSRVCEDLRSTVSLFFFFLTSFCFYIRKKVNK